jgi:agmatine deiminase
MPAEWERQEAVWLAWPHNGETWPGDALSRVRESYTEVIRHLSRDQRISLLVDDSTSEEQARQLIAYLGVDASAIRFLHIPTCDAWIRDYGPTFLVKSPSAPASEFSVRGSCSREDRSMSTEAGCF